MDRPRESLLSCDPRQIISNAAFDQLLDQLSRGPELIFRFDVVNSRRQVRFSSINVSLSEIPLALTRFICWSLVVRRLQKRPGFFRKPLIQQALLAAHSLY